MRILIVHLLIFSLINTQVFASICNWNFKNALTKSQEYDLKRMHRLRRMEYLNQGIVKYRKQIQAALKLKVRPRGNKKNQSALDIKYALKVKDFERAIQDGDLQFIIDNWNSIYRNVEIYYTYFKTNIKEIEKLYDQIAKLPKREAKQLKRRIKNKEKKLRKAVTFMANDFELYKRSRYKIDELRMSPYCDENCKLTIKAVENSLGVESFENRGLFSQIIKSKKREPIQKMELFIHQNSLTKEISEIKKFAYEVFDLAIPSFMNIKDPIYILLRKLEKNVPQQYQKIKALFVSAINQNAKLNHFDDLDDINRFNAPIDVKFDMVMNQNAKSNKNEFLTTVARRNDPQTRVLWQELKDYAEGHQINVFAKDIQQASEMADKLGPLSPNYRPNNISKYLVLGAVLAAGGGYFYISSPDTELHQDNTTNDTIDLDPYKSSNHNTQTNNSSQAVIEIDPDQLEEIRKNQETMYKILKEASDTITK